MTVSSTTSKVSYSGNSSTTVFAYTFKVFDEDDLTVILRNNTTGAETVQTITTHYTVSGVGNAGGGNVTFVTAPTTGTTVVIRRESSQTQDTDYTPNDPFPAESHEDALDKLTFIAQELQEELDRSIKVSRTNTITSSEFTVGASTRANKIFAFDSNGDLAVTQEIGTYQGTDATTTTSAYKERDLIKSTTAAQLNNVYICVADSVAGDLLTDTDHFELVVDAVSAATSATNAATSATNAATSATNASTSATNAATSETNAATSETNAATSETNAATSATNAATSETNAANSATAAEATFDLFDDSYLGAKTSNPSVDNDGNALQDGALYFDTTNNVMKVYDLGTTTWFQLTPTVANQTNINTVAGIASDVTTVAGVSSNVTTVAGVSANVTTVAGVSSDVTTVAGISANVTTVAGDSADIATVAGISSDVTTVATNNANVTTVATNITGVNSFAERYRVGASDPTTSLDEGDLAYNSTVNQLKYYDGSAWQGIAPGIASVSADATPQLGGNLDLNGNNITGSGNIPAANLTGTLPAIDGSALTGIATDLVNDTTPQLGGNLDVNGNEITSASNGNVVVNPNGTGTIELEAATNITGVTTFAGNAVPDADGTRDLGTTTVRYANVYADNFTSGDMILDNTDRPFTNSVDGTQGRWRIQEGSDDLFIINELTGKKYKFKLEDV